MSAYFAARLSGAAGAVFAERFIAAAIPDVSVFHRNAFGFSPDAIEVVNVMSHASAGLTLSSRLSEKRSSSVRASSGDAEICAGQFESSAAFAGLPKYFSQFFAGREFFALMFSSPKTSPT